VPHRSGALTTLCKPLLQCRASASGLPLERGTKYCANGAILRISVRTTSEPVGPHMDVPTQVSWPAVSWRAVSCHPKSALSVMAGAVAYWTVCVFGDAMPDGTTQSEQLRLLAIFDCDQPRISWHVTPHAGLQATQMNSMTAGHQGPPGEPNRKQSE
jgi:hypothetical protein